MGFRRLTMDRLQDLVRLHRRGVAVRRIARTLRMGRNTVTDYSEALLAAGLLEGDPEELPEPSDLRAAVEKHKGQPKLPRQQQSSLKRWLPIIDAKSEDGVGPTAIYDFLRLEHKDDFRGSLSAVKRRCAQLRRARGVKPEDAVIRVETDPGDVAQVDFGYVGELYDDKRGVLRKAWVFVMTLGYSRHMTARIVFDQKVETWLQVHIECFEEFGGVPRTIVPDNLKAAVVRSAFRVDGETSLNKSYRELARHYGFVVDPTPPRSPEKKGKVESSVRYLKSNYFKAHAPEDIRDARAGMQRWLVEVAGQRRHGTTGKKPTEVFEQEEKPVLLPLPTNRLELVAWQRAKVHRDCHATFRGEYYSAPWKLIGQEVDLRITRSAVTVSHNDQHVCVHDRVKRGQRATIEPHLPDHRSSLRHRSRTYWVTLADAMGEPVGTYVRAIFDSDDVLSKLRVVQAIVTHLQTFPEHRARAACVRALHYRSFTYAGIKNILRRGLDLTPLLGGGNKLAEHWSHKPRFSRVPLNPNDDNEPRSDSCPEEASPVRDPRDDGPPHAASDG